MNSALYVRKQRSVDPKGEQPWNSQLHSVPQHLVNMEMPLFETHGTHISGDGAAGATVLGKYAVKKSLSSQTSVHAQLNVEMRNWDSLEH